MDRGVQLKGPGHLYTLVGHTPVPCDDLTEWARWFQTADRVVFQDQLEGHLVSTVFLGLDHRFLGKGPPILFETMVFCKHEKPACEFDCDQRRYCTWLEAEAGHKVMVGRTRLVLEMKRISKLKWDK